MANANGADARDDLSTTDAYASSDATSGGGDAMSVDVRSIDAVSVDGRSIDATSMDASVDVQNDEKGVIADANGDATFIVTSCGTLVPRNTLGGCNPVCFPLDAGALAALDAGDAGLFGTQCNSLCGPTQCGSCGGSWSSCQPTEDGGVSLIQCNCPLFTGRRPEGLLASPPGGGTPLGAYFAEIARLEAASVDAFRHLRRELIAHGAPRRLVKAAERAARDEIRHARMTRALAARYGGGAMEAKVESRPVRSLEAIAVENAVEGCVHEAFGALVAHWQAVAAMDPVIRAAMARIARDETRHAALAFQVDGWICGRLGKGARERVSVARERALGALAFDEPEAPAAIRAKLGLPTSAQSRFLVDQLARIAA